MKASVAPQCVETSSSSERGFESHRRQYVTICCSVEAASEPKLVSFFPPPPPPSFLLCSCLPRALSLSCLIPGSRCRSAVVILPAGGNSLHSSSFCRTGCWAVCPLWAGGAGVDRGLPRGAVLDGRPRRVGFAIRSYYYYSFYHLSAQNCGSRNCGSRRP